MATGRGVRTDGSGRLGRFRDYVFGRNMLIGLAALMLLVISGYATWSGMSDFILGVSSDENGRALPGGLSVSNEFIVIAIVVTLTFLMWLALRETFGAKRLWRERLVTFPLYLFLALWSIGFGYGFWWSLIAGQEATRTSLAGLQEDARDAASLVAARIDAVKVQLDSVVSWSDGQMAREEASGGTCGKASGAGRGPLFAARQNVRDSVATLRDGIVNSWIAPIQNDLDELRRSAAALDGASIADRQRQFNELASQTRGRAKNIAARSNALGQSTANEMRALAAVVSIRPGKPGYSCFDPTLAQRLKQAALQAGQPAVLELRNAEFTEGPAGVANAVKRLWSNMGAYAQRLGAFVLSGGKAEAGDGLGLSVSGRDLIALLATIGVDLGLFVMTVLNPPVRAPLRMTPELERQISNAIDVAIRHAPGIENDFAWVRKHLIEHTSSRRPRWYSIRSKPQSATYFVIPNLYDPKNELNETKRLEQERALVMNQLTGVLTDLEVIRPMTDGELASLKAEEGRASRSDLSKVRKEWMASNKEQYTEDEQKRINALREKRNHGVFSKAESALAVAGWSEDVRGDIEVFRVAETDGLTPLLYVLNQPLAEPAAQQRQVPPEAAGAVEAS